MKKKGLRIFICLCAAFGWWGVLYPQLTMTPDTYRVICEGDTVQKEPKVIEWDFDSDIYWSVLNADPGEIRFESKLLQEIKTFVEQRRGIDESGK